MANIYLLFHQALLWFTVANGQMFFDDDIIEDDVDFEGMAGFIGVGGATETPTVTPTITPSTTVSTIIISTTFSIIPTSSFIPISSTAGVCPPLNPPINGTVTITCNPVQCVAVFQCDRGFILSGIATLKCRYSIGTWDGPPPTCVPRDCGIPLVNNGQYNGNTQTGDTGEIVCNANYGLGSQSNEITCGPDGWSTIPTCNFENCNEITNPNNGNVTVNCRQVGCIATFDCDDGYRPVPGSQVNCLNGGWKSTVRCIPDGGTTMKNGTVNYKSLFNNTELDAATKEELETKLTGYFEGKLGTDFETFIITGVDPDTGDIEVEVHIKDNTSARKKLAKAFSALSKESPIDIYGRNVTADFTYLDGLLSQVNDTFTAEEAACRHFLHIDPAGCPNTFVCRVVNDEVTCVYLKKAEEVNLGLIIGLSVGIPLAVLCLVIAICCCCRCCACCRIAPKAADDESVQYSMVIGWLPRFKLLPLRLNTRGNPSYLWGSQQGNFSSHSSDSSSNSSRSPKSHRSRSRSKSGSKLGSRSGSRSRGSEDPFLSNFSWDNMYRS